MIRPVEVEPRENYRIWLRYSDGTEGEVDLSHLVGRGVFTSWKDPGFFQDVRISEYQSIVWGEGDEQELCSDALYIELTGLPVDEALTLIYGPKVVYDDDDEDDMVSGVSVGVPSKDTHG